MFDIWCLFVWCFPVSPGVPCFACLHAVKAVPEMEVPAPESAPLPSRGGGLLICRVTSRVDLK